MITKEILEREYLENRKSSNQIGKEYGFNGRTILDYLYKNNIKTRSRSESIKNAFFTKEFLEKEYLENEKSIYKIGKEYGVSHTCIIYNLKKNNISRRSKHRIPKGFIRGGYKYMTQKKAMHQIVWSQNNGFVQVPKGCLVHHRDGNKLNNDIDNLVLMPRDYHAYVHDLSRCWNKNGFLLDKDFLEEQHLDNKKSCIEIANKIGVNEKTIYTYLKYHDIPIMKHNLVFLDKETLKKEYIDDGLSSRELAKKYDTTKATIIKYLRKYGIQIKLSNRDKKEVI